MLREDEYKAITKKFTMDLITTRLKRIARVGTADKKRENKSPKLSTDIRLEVNLPVAYQNFTSQIQAIE